MFLVSILIFLDLNLQTRVSGLMTNAPFMLNVDCDMVVSNPKIIQHAVCILMDSKNGKDVAFVQCFQQFYDGIKDDPFGNQWVAAFEVSSQIQMHLSLYLFYNLCSQTDSVLLNAVYNKRHGRTSRTFLWRNKHLP